VSVRQAAGTWPLHLAEGRERHGIIEPRAAIDAAGGHRLATSGPRQSTVVSRIKLHFGPRSEKYDREIQQLELRLEDLETNQAAVEPPPLMPAMVVLKQEARRKPARRPLPAELPRETETIAPAQEACPTAVASCAGSVKMCRRRWNMYQRGLK